MSTLLIGDLHTAGEPCKLRLTEWTRRDEVRKEIAFGQTPHIFGRMDDATINGVVCGGLAKPFTATSPEVIGSWKFTPTSESAGSFLYGAKNVGGATGSGSGTYRVIPESGGSVRIQLAGKGSIHSPLGTFSSKITESLTLTPIPSCERVGDR